jgi:hypothetical protein
MPPAAAAISRVSAFASAPQIRSWTAGVSFVGRPHRPAMPARYGGAESGGESKAGRSTSSNRNSSRAALTGKGRLLGQDIMVRLMPVIVAEAIQVIQDLPDASDQDLEAEIFARSAASMKEYNEKLVEVAEAKVKEQRDPKPRFEERDDEIVRLKDEILPDGTQRSFGQVHQKIVEKWPTTQAGKPLTRDAVINAYKRRTKKR